MSKNRSKLAATKKVRLLRFPSLVYVFRVKDQGRTKDGPRNDQRTPNLQKVLFIKIVVSFLFLVPCLILPRELREKTEGTPHQLPMNKKCALLRLPSL